MLIHEPSSKQLSMYGNTAWDNSSNLRVQSAQVEISVNDCGCNRLASFQERSMLICHAPTQWPVGKLAYWRPPILSSPLKYKQFTLTRGNIEWWTWINNFLPWRKHPITVRTFEAFVMSLDMVSQQSSIYELLGTNFTFLHFLIFPMLQTNVFTQIFRLVEFFLTVFTLSWFIFVMLTNMFCELGTIKKPLKNTSIFLLQILLNIHFLIEKLLSKTNFKYLSSFR